MSNTYISPSGNPEIWNEKPKGYYTPDEWDGMHRPAPPPPLTLEEARTVAYERIKQVRDNRVENGGLVWQGYLVSTDKEARDAIMGKALQFIMGQCTEAEWKMSDGEYANLDQTGFSIMSAAVGKLVQDCYTVEKAKRHAVEALPTAEAVLAWLDVPENLLAGWPTDGAE